MPRKARPWYRMERKQWFGRLDGKQVPLGVTDPADEVAALLAFKAMVDKVQQMPDAGRTRFATAAGLVAGWLADREPHVKRETHGQYVRILNPFLARFGTLPPGNLAPDEVEADARRRKWSDTTRANYLCTVEQALKWGGFPVRLRKPPKASAGAESVIPPEAFDKLMLVAVGDWQRVIRFLWLTGCRPQEAATTTAEQVDWSAGVVRLKDHKTAHRGKQRQLYLCPEALDLLRAQRERHKGGLLFRGKGGKPFSRQAFVMKFRRLSDRIGRRVTAYGLRHSFATRALERGIPEAQVAALLGHTGTQMLFRHYSHLTSNARLLREQAAKVSG